MSDVTKDWEKYQLEIQAYVINKKPFNKISKSLNKLSNQNFFN